MNTLEAIIRSEINLQLKCLMFDKEVLLIHSYTIRSILCMPYQQQKNTTIWKQHNPIATVYMLLVGDK